MGRLSNLSKVSHDAIKAVLIKHYSAVETCIINTADDLPKIVKAKPDLVFLGVKYVPISGAADRANERVWVSEFLDSHDIKYTGSGRIAHERDVSKELAKQCVLEANLQTAPYTVVRKNSKLTASDIDMPYPVFVKPLNLCGGQGVDDSSVANDLASVKEKTESIAQRFGVDSIVEQFLPGREFSVAVLKNSYSADYDLMPVELIAPENAQGVRMLSSDVKSADAERVIRVADVALARSLQVFARNVFDALGASDYGRIDIRLDVHGIPHFLEANLTPSLIRNYGSFPKACFLTQGLDYESMIQRIVRLGLAGKVSNSPVAYTVSRSSRGITF